MPEQQTRLLADRYELITPLGRGTMGTVWRAYDRSLGREVAVKEIRQEPGLSETQRAELRERMIREGRTAARISHPSVATVHDAIIENGSPWIIMELVQARSLEQVVEEEGPLPPRLVAEIGVDLLGALRAAHAQGVLHRDVKPGNVLITESGRVVLTDFGIAKAEGDTNLTKTGMVIGSPGYTAPERARGEHTGPESDLWSLGATLYFAVEGRPAYERSSVAETLAALMTDRADPPAQAGPLRPVLEQLLERDHTLRLAPAQAAAMLRAVADTPSTSTGPAPVAPVVPPGPARTRPAAPADASPAADGSRAAPASAPPASASEAYPADEAFDADRTMLVIRPKGGLRLPTGASTPVSAPEPPAPASQALASAFPPATPPAAPPAGPRPGAAPDERPTEIGRLPRPGGPASASSWRPGAHDEGHPDLMGPEGADRGRTWLPGASDERHPEPEGAGEALAWRPGTPGGSRPGTPRPGEERAWDQAGRPETPDGEPPRQPAPDRSRLPYQGLGTDLFAIAGRGGPEQTTTPARTRVGLIVLMGVAAVALVAIMILVVANMH